MHHRRLQTLIVGFMDSYAEYDICPMSRVDGSRNSIQALFLEKWEGSVQQQGGSGRSRVSNASTEAPFQHIHGILYAISTQRTKTHMRDTNTGLTVNMCPWKERFIKAANGEEGKKEGKDRRDCRRERE